MTNQNEEQSPQKTPTLPMIAVLGGVAMLSGFLVVLVFQLTKPYIAENQRRATQEAVSKVIPDAVVQKQFLIADGEISPFDKDKKGLSIFAGYDAGGALLGIAAPANAQGYADMITLLYGYDHTCECIRGIRILKMAETPGHIKRAAPQWGQDNEYVFGDLLGTPRETLADLTERGVLH